MITDPLDFVEFLDQLDADRRAGRTLPLSHYLLRFPRIEEAIAREYLRTATQAAAEGAAVANSPDAATAGEARIGPFRLLRELGRGGQGVVHLAEDTRFHRLVALKVLAAPSSAIDTSARMRFRREAASIARLEHRFLCGIYEADLEGERPYIAMRYVPGETLRDRLQRQRAAAGIDAAHGLPQRNAIPPLLVLIEHAARALHAAHEAGVVHRDIKPGNIQIDAEGRPVLLDFGLARFDTAQPDEQFTLTAPGQVLGTPAYMAPEQLLGDRQVDQRCDVYSLGATLYECLTLALPFPNSELAKSPSERMLKNPQQQNPAIRDELRVVIETAMATEPQRRYATALAFAEDLRRIREYEPIVARPATRWLRVRRWVRRNRRFVIVASTIATLALVGLSAVIAINNAQLAKAQHELDTGRIGAQAEFDPSMALLWARETAKYAIDARVHTGIYVALDRFHQRWGTMESARRLAWAVPYFAQGGDYVGFGAATNKLTIRRISTGEVLHEKNNATEHSHVSATADGEEFLATWQDGSIARWTAAQGFEPFHCEAPSLRGKRILSVDHVPLHPTRLLIATHQHDLILWDREANAERFAVRHEIGAEEHLNVVCSLDGRFVATTTSRPLNRAAKLATRGSVRIWNAADGGLFYEVPDREKRVNGIEFARDAPLFAVFYIDGRIALHDLEARRQRSSAHYPGEPTSVRFHPDRQRLLVAFRHTYPSPDQVELKRTPIRVLTLDGEEDQRLVGHAFQGAVAVTFSPNGELIASVGDDNTITLRSVRPQLEEQPKQQMGRLGSYPNLLQWSADGSTLLSGDVNGDVIAWSPSQPRIPILHHPDACTAVRFSPSAHEVVSGCERGIVRVWDRASGQLERALFTSEGAVHSILFTANGSTMVSMAHEAGVRVCTWSTRQTDFLPFPAVVTAIALSADSKHLAVGCGDGQVFLVDLASRQRRKIGDHKATVACAAFASNGASLVTGGGDRTARRWHLDEPALAAASASPFQPTEEFVSTVRGVYQAPDGKSWFLMTDHPKLFVWDGVGTQCKLAVPFVRGVSLHPKGTLMAVAVMARWCDLYELPATTLPLVQDKDPAWSRDLPNPGPLSLVEFGEAGRMLLAGSDNGLAHLVQVQGEPKGWGTMRGHTQRVSAIALSRDDEWAATASMDKTVRIWPTDPFRFQDSIQLPNLPREELETKTKYPGR